MLQRLIPAFAAIGTAVLIASPAQADGTTRVQQSDGTVQTYEHVSIRQAGQTLWLRSGDHQGVLEVTSGACSYRGELQRCLPYKTTLHQNGQTREIVLEHGTVYVNPTGDPQPLPHSSAQLGPHEVLVHLRTVRGTYVSVQGTVDAR